MAGRGYIGKISAIVTVNASQVGPGLSSAEKSFKTFARSTEQTLANFRQSSTRAFDGIFTPLQKLQRALAASQKSPINLDPAAARQIEQIALSAKQIAKPLADAAKNFDSLALSVQRQLSPAFQSVQTEADGVRQKIQSGAEVSSRELKSLASDVDVVAAAFGRLKEQQSLGSRLFSGQELNFVRPEVVDGINKLIAAQQKLSQAPASVRSSSIASDLLQDAQILREQIDRISARIERLNAQGLNVTVSNAALDGYLKKLSDVTLLTERISETPPAPEIKIDVDVADLENAGRQLQASLVERINAIDVAWDRGVRGLVGNVDEIDKRFFGLINTIEQLDLADRVDLDPAIAEFRNAIAAGEGYAKQLELVNKLEDQVGDIQSSRGDPTGSFGPSLPPGFGGSSDAGLGRSLTDAQRQLDRLRGTLVSVKGQVDALPAGVRSQFIPSIQQAEAEFRRLTALGVAASAQEIENAANNVDQLAESLRRAGQAASIPTFSKFSDDLSTRQAVGELQALQQVLSGIQAQAGGPAAMAYERYRQRLQEAVRTGTTGLPRVRAELVQLQKEAAQAAAATGRISFGAAFRAIQRGGDIGRQGFANFSLAVNQAAYAIDDFFSSTGGLEFKLRAVSNNITQLAFILGGTKGLLIGLAAVIGGQLAVAISKWINDGQSAEDQTKSLNDALARQKSLIEELAQAFKSLGDSIAEGVFSEAGKRARDFERDLDNVAKKQREVREARAAELDPDVQRQRARQQTLQRQLENETDPGTRVVLQRQIRDAQRREREATQAAAGRRVDGRDVSDAVKKAIERTSTALLGGLTGEARAAREREIQRQAKQTADAIPQGGAPEDVLRQRAAVQAEIDRLAPIVNQYDSFTTPGRVARDQVANLQQVLNALEIPLQKALDELSLQIVRSSRSAAMAIEDAQEDVADAIRRGVRGAGAFQAGLDNTARQLAEAQQQLKDAQEIEDPAQREREVRRAEDRVRDVRNRRDAIQEASREVRLGRTFGGERTTSALSSLENNRRFVNEQAGLIAKLRDSADAELEARRRLNQAIADGDGAAVQQAQAELEAAQAAGDLAAAAGEAALAMEDAVSRLRKIADDALSESERMADDAQQRFTEDPTTDNRRARDDAERQLIQDRARVNVAQDAISRTRSWAQDTVIGRALTSQLEEVRSEREQLAEATRISGVEADQGKMSKLAAREAALQASLENFLFEITKGEREQADAIAYEIDARKRLIEQLLKEQEFDRELERRTNPEGDPMRGLDLMETPATRAARELSQGLADINAAVDEQIRGILDKSNGRPTDEDRKRIREVAKEGRDAQRRFAEQQARQAAPAIFQLADEVKNALLQGPSRAALNATDVSTVDGAKELNRLIRGDDPARDANLLELQKQNETLKAILKELEDGGVVVDI